MGHRKVDDKFSKLPQRVRAVIEKCRGGQSLCKSIRHKETNDAEVLWFFEPSGRRAGPKSAGAAINSGFLQPAGDGLFGPDSSQTWRA